MPRHPCPAVIGPPATRTPNFNPSLNRISVPIEHAEAAQQLLWWLWLAALTQVTATRSETQATNVSQVRHAVTLQIYS